MPRIALVAFTGVMACVGAEIRPVQYGAELGAGGAIQPVTNDWPPAGPVVDTTRPDEADCWQNFNDVRPSRRNGGCAPTPTASGRFVQQARPTTCPGTMQPAVVGFTPERQPIWTCLPGCGPGDEYVTRWGQELLLSSVHFVLDVSCTDACATGTHRASYTTAFGDSSGGPSRPGDCVAGDPEPAVAAALVDEQARQRAARDRSVAAAFAEIDAFLAPYDADARMPVAQDSPGAVRLGAVFEGLRELRDPAILARVADARARWDRITRGHPRPTPPPPPPSPDVCTPACDEAEHSCNARCTTMDAAACATCASYADACRRACR